MGYELAEYFLIWEKFETRFDRKLKHILHSKNYFRKCPALQFLKNSIPLNCTGLCYCVKGKAISLQVGQAMRVREVEVDRLKDNRHMKVVRLSALRTGCFTPQEIFLVIISVRVCFDPKSTVWLEGLRQWKIPVTTSGFEPATFRLVAQCINHYANFYLMLLC